MFLMLISERELIWLVDIWIGGSLVWLRLRDLIFRFCEVRLFDLSFFDWNLSCLKCDCNFGNGFCMEIVFGWLIGLGWEVLRGGLMGGIVRIDDDEEKEEGVELLLLYLVFFVENVFIGLRFKFEFKFKFKCCWRVVIDGVIIVMGEIDDCLFGVEIFVVRKFGIDEGGCEGNLGNVLVWVLIWIRIFWSILMVCVSLFLFSLMIVLFLFCCVCLGICVYFILII